MAWANLLLRHHVVEHVGAGEHRVAEGVGRVEDLRVVARRLLRQLLRAVDLQHRRPQHLVRVRVRVRVSC